jgi:hypothetical protein
MSANEKVSNAVIEKRVRIACYFALLALALMLWSLIHPAPIAVVVAMSVGQAIGTLSMLFFLYAIVADLRRSYVRVEDVGAAKASQERQPPEAGGE